ncbi:hypothetical protein ACTFIU_001900 [Dictyostelium citrinum]
MDDVLLSISGNDFQYYYCNDLWITIQDSIVSLTENKYNHNFQNREIYYDYQRMIIILNNYIYHSSSLNERDNNWYIKGFKEINIVFIQLKNYTFDDIIMEDDRTLFINNLSPVFIQIIQLRRLFLIIYYNSYFFNNNISIPNDVNFSFEEIPLSFIDDDIYNWRDQTLNKIYINYNGYEQLGQDLIQTIDTVIYNVLNCDQIDNFIF